MRLQKPTMIKASILMLVLTMCRKVSCGTLSIEEGSHVVQIGQTRSTGAIDLICGGAYLGDRVVVFGAHCTNRNGRKPDIVRFGSVFGSSFDLHVVNITVHYRYKPQFDYHNMAVAFLDRDPETVNHKIKPACILKPHPKPNHSVQLIGPIETQLDRADLVSMGSEKCHEYYNPQHKLRFGVLLCCFCARNANIERCTDLHSSPLQILLSFSGKKVPFLIGHKSIGKPCGTNAPAIYTRYGSYFEWIETVTGMKMDPQECLSRV
ncbi:serine protease snake-like [Toxorhynchites rutilus septentrionalis]|uniref:serine protease snake-like n=1 Tax=Toxorhynchites rutilus septentrionalis TaxID=329112 RepID=UPI002479D7C3|nr:serine protease snake-like [Toxorhynchites rutilus septentrionalis]